MLVLTRKREQKIWLGPDVWITVVDIRGDKVRLGIEAPVGITVLREEVIKAMSPEKFREVKERAAAVSYDAPRFGQVEEVMREGEGFRAFIRLDGEAGRASVSFPPGVARRLIPDVGEHVRVSKKDGALIISRIGKGKEVA